MDFKNNKPIYLQIVDFCFQKIITNEWLEEQRIPSVRELGVLLEVNPNTAMRAFEYMQTESIIYLKRGVGYYVSSGANKLIHDIQKKEFFEETLPDFFQTMQMLNIDIEDISRNYKEWKKSKE